jgi:hypothetical protein
VAGTDRDGVRLAAMHKQQPVKPWPANQRHGIALHVQRCGEWVMRAVSSGAMAMSKVRLYGDLI